MKTLPIPAGMFPPKMQEFIAHWTSVNAALGASPLLLKGAYTLANFTTDRTAAVAAIDAVPGADNTLQIAAADRDQKKAAARDRLTQFRAAVRGLLAGTTYVNGLPTIPPFGGKESDFLKAFTDMADLWAKINAATIPGFTGPLLLSGGYAIATFNTDLTALRNAYIAHRNAETTAAQARESRDALLFAAYERMKQYRQVVVARLPIGDPLLNTVPAITPPPGSTPDPVTLNGAFNTQTNRADFNYTRSTAGARFLRYQFRYNAGGRFNAQTASVLGNVDNVDTLTFQTATGLSVSGNKIAVKCYVETDQGHEAGSNTVVITKP